MPQYTHKNTHRTTHTHTVKTQCMCRVFSLQLLHFSRTEVWPPQAGGQVRLIFGHEELFFLFFFSFIRSFILSSFRFSLFHSFYFLFFLSSFHLFSFFLSFLLSLIFYLFPLFIILPSLLPTVIPGFLPALFSSSSWSIMTLLGQPVPDWPVLSQCAQVRVT